MVCATPSSLHEKGLETGFFLWTPQSLRLGAFAVVLTLARRLTLTEEVAGSPLAKGDRSHPSAGKIVNLPPPSGVTVRKCRSSKLRMRVVPAFEAYDSEAAGGEVGEEGASRRTGATPNAAFTATKPQIATIPLFAHPGGSLSQGLRGRFLAPTRRT